jgi:Carboxypeptidase regulatory-like domain
MSSGISIPGVFRVEGTPLPTNSTVRIGLRPPAPNGLSSALQLVNADGTFSMTNVFAGEYRIAVLAAPPDYYVKEARIEQTDVLNQPWVIGNAIRGSLEVVLSSAGGQIEGTVVDARSQPVSALQTVLIPDQDRTRTELLKTATTDHEGRFSFRGITPGNYKIFAWEAIDANAFLDPEVLSQYEQQARAVRVVEGDRQKLEVKMIPAKAQ